MSGSVSHIKALKLPFLYHSRTYHCPASQNVQGPFVFLERVNFGKDEAATVAPELRVEVFGYRHSNISMLKNLLEFLRKDTFWAPPQKLLFGGTVVGA